MIKQFCEKKTAILICKILFQNADIQSMAPYVMITIDYAFKIV